MDKHNEHADKALAKFGDFHEKHKDKIPGGANPFKEKSDKCCCCIDLKTGVLILGVLSIVGAISACLCGIGIFLSVFTVDGGMKNIVWLIIFCIALVLLVYSAFPYITYF